jgi:oligopeptidase A
MNTPADPAVSTILAQEARNPANAPDNPLASDYLAAEALPPYHLLNPQQVAPAIDLLIAQAQACLNSVVAPETPATWESVMAPLTSATERLGRAWSAVHHMGGVMDSPEWREATNSRLEAVTRFWSALAQDPKLYAKVKRLGEAPDVIGQPAREKAVANSLRDFKLGGAELAPEAQKSFAEMSARLAALSQKFSEQLLDSTNASVIVVEDAARLNGVPDPVRAAAKAEAEKRGLTAAAVFTLQQPSLLPVLQFATDRALRQEIYSKNARRASELAEEGPAHDNTPVMGEILALRQAQARLLGFTNAAETSLAAKMADRPQTVIAFLRDLAQKARASAEKDLAELKAFAHKELGLDTLAPWDIAYASEKLRQSRYAFSEEEVRQYFPLPSVLNGLFSIVKTLFGVEIRPLLGLAPAPVWHPDVQVFEVRRGSDTVGHLYLDLYARATKRGGAWMDDSRGRRRRGSHLQKPVALLTCNFAAPTDGKPSTLTHDDVITLFHEFGHGLHHLLTQVDDLEVSGINGVEWDAVELPSQFMENFCWEWDTLHAMTAHVDSGAPLPRDLYDRMVAAKNFQSGLFMLRQVEFSLFDMRIHAELTDLSSESPEQAGSAIATVLAEVRDEVAVIQPPPFHRFAQSFSHIFAGGYAAGYYSYKWAEVLSADAYAAFEEAGPSQYSAVGEKFWREILSRGGSRPAMESFQAFRGRPPEPDALLRHNGLAQAA